MLELVGHYGGDLSHALSAWTSTSRELTPDKMDRIPNLLKMLADNNHHTPFEKSCLHFLCRVDQATHIHLLKHRIGVSINGESARYKELKEDDPHLPLDWKGVPVGDLKDVSPVLTDWHTALRVFSAGANDLYHKCLSDLTNTLGRKRAKESARFFKTMNSQITLDVMFNWRSFAHFYKLRAADDAQAEVRQLAEGMLELVIGIPDQPFKHTMSAFNMPQRPLEAQQEPVL